MIVVKKLKELKFNFRPFYEASQNLYVGDSEEWDCIFSDLPDGPQKLGVWDYNTSRLEDLKNN